MTDTQDTQNQEIDIEEKIFDKYQDNFIDYIISNLEQMSQEKDAKKTELAEINIKNSESSNIVKIFLNNVKRSTRKGSERKFNIELTITAQEKNLKILLQNDFERNKNQVCIKIFSSIKNDENSNNQARDGLRNLSRPIIYLDSQEENNVKIPGFISWGIKEKTNRDLYKNFFGMNPNKNGSVKFTGFLENISVRLPDNDFQIFIKNSTTPEEETFSLDAPAEEVSNTLKIMAQSHARQWLARCVERVIYLAYHSSESIIFTSNGKTSDIPLGQAIGFSDPSADEEKESESTRIFPSDLKKLMEKEKGLYFPWSVYQSACITLNLGRNLILVGPPGCGKTELALALGDKMSDKNTGAKMVTASPGWTSGDLIGRYFPDPDSENKLIFQRGVLLDALEQDQCLIIDEMNRANIDECFGELFTVLSGKSVDLPYKEVDEDEDEDKNISRRLKIVRINGAKESKTLSNRRSYKIGHRFRIIGTMNDFDRSSLHQMSFALLRRFNVIRIEPPEKRELEELLEKIYDNLTKDDKFIRIGSGSGSKSYIGEAKDIIGKIFIINPEFSKKNENIKEDDNDKKNGLVLRNIVGVATMIDSLRFIIESVHGDYSVQKDSGRPAALIASQAMHAFMIYCAPQLDALDTKKIEEVKEYISSIFAGHKYTSITEAKDKNVFLLEESQTDLSEYFKSKFNKIYNKSGI